MRRDLHRDAGGCERERRLLRAAHPLAEEEAAEEHREQRVHVVTEARFEHLSGVDGPDVEPPVEGDEEAAAREPERGARLAADEGEGLPPSARGGEHERHEDGGPDDAVPEYLERRHALEQLPVERHRAPPNVREKNRRGSLLRLRHVHRLPTRILYYFPRRRVRCGRARLRIFHQARFVINYQKNRVSGFVLRKEERA